MGSVLKKALVASAFAAVAMVATPASAVVVILSPGAGGTLTGDFGDSGIAAGAFTRIFDFTLPQSGFTSGTVSTSFSGGQTNVDFTSVTLNGTNFALTGTGQFEFGSIYLATMSGAQQLVVNGISDGNGSFGGQITFAPIQAAIPEPATWAMMMFGFGAVGAAMRRRNVKVSRVSFA